MGSKKAIPTTIEFVDIAGLVRGASKGEGLGNQFLSYVREVDAIAHVVRCFPDLNIVHVDGSIDPKRDIETINIELALSDLATVAKRLQAVNGQTKTGDKKALKEKELLEKIEGYLNSGKPMRTLEMSGDERCEMRDVRLLTGKPVLYVLNIDEKQMPNPDANVSTVLDIAKAEGAGAVTICGKLESDLAELSDEEAKAYEEEIGLKEMGLLRLIKAGYDLLQLITFFTANEKETRAWTVKKGTGVQQAAGKVHTDMEKGFISAEVIGFDELVRAGSPSKARESGILRTEGRDYTVRDGDIIYIRFNA